MSKKPLFDSEQGRKFLGKLKEGADQILDLKERLSSKDASIRKAAIEEMEALIAQAKETMERIKKTPGFNPQDVRRMFENKDNFTPEQIHLQETIVAELKEAFMPRARKKTKTKTTKAKKSVKKSQTKNAKKWVRS